MQSHLVIRLLAVLITLAIVVGLPERWVVLTFGVGFGHYFLALRYSTRPLAALGRRPAAAVWLLGLLALGGWLYATGFSLLLFFALHHALNESYLAPKATPGGGAAERPGRAPAFALHLMLYLVLVRRSPDLHRVDPTLLFAGLGVAYGVFLADAAWRAPRAGARGLAARCGFELLALGAVGASCFVRFSYLHIVLFHFVFWMLFPLPKHRALGRASLLEYAFATTALSGLFVALGLAAFSSGGAWPALFLQQFLFWSYVHITLSFALSDANPVWLVRRLRPAPTVALRA